MILGHHFGSRSSATTAPCHFCHVPRVLSGGGICDWGFDWWLLRVVLLGPAPAFAGGGAATGLDRAAVLSRSSPWQGKDLAHRR